MNSSTPKDPHRIVHGDDFGWKAETLPYKSVPELFRLRVKELGDATMMRQKELGIWRAYSWNEVATIVAEIGAGLVSLGFEPGEVASVLSNTCREWVWCDLAVQSMGGVCNGIYPTDAASQVDYLCSDSRSVYLFVEDDEQLDKYLEIADRLPLVRRVIVFDMEGLGAFDDPRVISLEQLRELGPHPSAAASRAAGRAQPLAQVRRRGGAGLHLGHHRPAQGRDDQPGQHLSRCWPRCRHAVSKACRAAASASPSCRCATSPSA